jgi:hypothetical protein
METMLACEHPWVKEYFRGKRSRAAGMAAEHAAERVLVQE